MNRFCSISSQLLQLFPRLEFQELVHKSKAVRHARGFTCWTQLVSMLFCQLGRAYSLREICGGLASCEGELSHLGIRIPKRSTLAYANEHRPCQLYEQLFHRLLGRCRTLTVGRRRKPFRFNNPLVSLDATVIDLCASLFDWAQFQRTEGAVQLHLLLDHDGYLPTLACITDGKASDLSVARKLQFPPGTIVVFDRGFGVGLQISANLDICGTGYGTLEFSHCQDQPRERDKTEQIHKQNDRSVQHRASSWSRCNILLPVL